MANYDAETFFDDMLNLFQTQLDAKLAALNAEKGDSLIKEAFPDDEYLLNFNQIVMNKDTFVYFGFIDVANPETNGCSTSEAFKMFFSVATIGSDDETLEMKKILRYTRALEEVAQENSTKFQTSTLEIETFKPAVEQFQESNWWLVGGIHITGVIG